MSLLEIRNLFIERSGREDLHIPATGADNGADFFIQSGQKTIERLLQIDKSWGRKFATMSAGDYYVILKGCRAIKRAWISNSSGRSDLEKLTIDEFRELYSDAPDEITPGSSKYYTPISLRTYPDDTNVIIDYLYDNKLTDTETEDYAYKGVLITPPPSENSLVEIFGLFYSPKLENDSDTNFWSELHPEILLLGALYQLEVSYRNTSGAADWMNALMLELEGMEKDWVEEEIANVTQIVG